MIIVRTLRRDIAKYNKMDEEVCQCHVLISSHTRYLSSVPVARQAECLFPFNS